MKTSKQTPEQTLCRKTMQTNYFQQDLESDNNVNYLYLLLGFMFLKYLE